MSRPAPSTVLQPADKAEIANRTAKIALLFMNFLLERPEPGTDNNQARPCEPAAAHTANGVPGDDDAWFIRSLMEASQGITLGIRTCFYGFLGTRVALTSTSPHTPCVPSSGDVHVQDAGLRQIQIAHFAQSHCIDGRSPRSVAGRSPHPWGVARSGWPPDTSRPAGRAAFARGAAT